MGNSLDTHAKDAGAVITGGASGIGLAVARRCLNLGLHVFIADILQENLTKAKAQLEAEIPGAHIGTCVADVSSAEANRQMCEQTQAFLQGKDLCFVHFNAGTGLGRAGHDSSYKGDFALFQKTIEIDLYSIFHGFANFVPVMSKNRTRPGVILTTSSENGLSNNLGQAAYTVAKHGVTLMTESLHASLAKDFPKPVDGGAPLLTAAVLCPCATKTNIIANASNFGDKTKEKADAGNRRAQQMIAMDFGTISPDLLADRLHEALKRQIFYIVGYDQAKDVDTLGGLWLKRAENLVRGEGPVFNEMGPNGLVDPDGMLHGAQQRARDELAKGNWAFAGPPKSKI